MPNEKDNLYPIDPADYLADFKRYIAIDSRSNPESPDTPSSPGQFDLAEILYQDLEEIGLTDLCFDRKNCYVYGKLPANKCQSTLQLGLLAHMDTAPDLDGKCLNPQLVNYQGGKIQLNEDYCIDPEVFPFLNDLKGEDLITTDGTCLLGADDKAGVTAIVNALKYLKANPDLPHVGLSVAFVPDEEIGHGASLLDLERFGADFAYTVDGGEIGGLEYETFNACQADIQIKGLNVHPGSAKDKMINASLVAMELHAMLPVNQRPEYTSGYEGFFLLTQIEGKVEGARMEYIIRDHDRTKFEQKKQLITQAVEFLKTKYGPIIDLHLEDSYYNMRSIVEQRPEVIELACKAMRSIGVEPEITPIRGGTDGAQLSFRGLPCPNLFTGGYNFHGRYEFAVVSQMVKATENLVAIANQACQLLD